MSVNAYLDNRSRSAYVNSVEKEKIKTSIAILRNRLRSYFGSDIEDQLIFGSYSRGTILPRKMDSQSDVDYMVVFSDNSCQPQTYLNRLARFATAKYTRSQISQSNPTIVLSLNHIKFELVPAIDNGIFSKSLKIPAKASSYLNWVSTDPTGFNNDLITANQEHDNKIKPLIRLVKYWNATHSARPFDSYDLEKSIVEYEFSWWFKTPTLKDYFYEYMLNIGAGYYAPQYAKNAVSKAQEIITMAKRYEARKQFGLARNEIKKLVPSAV